MIRRILFNDGTYVGKLRAIAPRLREALDSGELLGCHMFQEEWATLDLRLRGPSEGLVRRLLAEHNGEEVAWEDDTPAYADFWPLALEFFELAAKAAIAFLTTPPERVGRLFYARKLVHCLLNTWGFVEYEGEIEAYRDWIGLSQELAALRDDLPECNRLAEQIVHRAVRGSLGL